MPEEIWTYPTLVGHPGQRSSTRCHHTGVADVHTRHLRSRERGQMPISHRPELGVPSERDGATGRCRDARESVEFPMRVDACVVAMGYGESSGASTSPNTMPSKSGKAAFFCLAYIDIHHILCLFNRILASSRFYVFIGAHMLTYITGRKYLLQNTLFEHVCFNCDTTLTQFVSVSTR